MSLPREWSLNNQQQQAALQQQQQQQNFYNQQQQQEYEGSYWLRQHSIGNASPPPLSAAAASPASFNLLHQASSQEMVGAGAGPTVIDENMNQHVNQLGSLFSIHSAPVYDAVSCNAAGINSPKSAGHYFHHLHEYRPASLVVQATASSGPIVPPAHLSPPETLADDEDNDNLLTISSLTARPLIAKSRELGCRPAATASSASTRRRLNKAKRQEARRRRRRHKRLNFEPLDGGYGWVVVFGAFFVQFWVAGLVKSYGLLYVEVMETFTDSSASVASWIPAILSCLCLALAPVTSMLSQKYSCRVVVFVGGLFCSLGLIISFFATSLIHLLFTFGVLTGIGGGLSTTPGIILVSQYFDKHRALANGICVSGTAAGSFVFPMLIEYLVGNFGFHGTLLILGGCMLHVCASASLYRPLEMNYPMEPLPPPPLAELEPAAKSAELTSGDAQLQATAVKRQKLEMLFAQHQHDETAKNNMLNELFHHRDHPTDQDLHANEVLGCIELRLTDSEEEKDIMGEALSMKPISKIRSSSILHSVEDLSTDSTCFYKSRSSLQRSLRSSALAVCPAATATATGTSGTCGGGDSKVLPNQPQPVISLTAEQSASKESLPQRLTRYIDLSLLRDTRFIMMCLSVTLMSTGSPYMLYYLPAYVNAQNYSKSEAGYLVAISAAFDLCGRLGLGWLSDLQLFDRRKGYIGSIVGAGVAVLVIPLAHSFYVLACSVSMYGLCLGCWFLLVPVLLADQYGTDKISSSYGLVRMFQSIGAITVPPLAGYMRDVTGSYNVCFLFMGSCMVLGGIPLLIVSDDSSANSSSNKKLPEPELHQAITPNTTTDITSKTDCKDVAAVLSPTATKN